MTSLVGMPAPDRFVDASAGSVLLRFVPIHVERLHGPYPSAPIWIGDEHASRTSPLLAGAAPVDLVLRSGLAPAELADCGVPTVTDGTRFENRYWFDWLAYVSTPFGWCDATPQFVFGEALQGRGSGADARGATSGEWWSSTTNDATWRPGLRFGGPHSRRR